MESGKYLVRVSCMTYNQSAYITDAFNGFVMQQTDFSYVCTIVDDASTDGEQDVIRKYLNENFDLKDSTIAYEKDTDYGHVTFARHKSNKNCYFAVIYLNENHYSQKKSKAPYIKEWMDTKYIAPCEGDDYWTNPLKLQKQVDFLEEHEEYVVCSHNYIYYYQKEKKFADRSYYAGEINTNEERDFVEYSLDNYFESWWTQPLTCIYRNGIYLKEIPINKYRHFRDDVFYYYVLKEGKGALLSDVMGVYRIHDGGVWQGMDYIKQHKAGRDNALAIYMNENDKRALCRASRDEMTIVTKFWGEHYRWKALKEIFSYKKRVPVSEYHRFLRSVGEWFGGKIKRKTKAVFKLSSEYVL